MNPADLYLEKRDTMSNKSAPKPTLERDEISNTYGQPKIVAEIPKAGASYDRVIEAQDLVAEFEASFEASDAIAAYAEARALLSVADFRNSLAEFMENRARNLDSLSMDIAGQRPGSLRDGPPVFDKSCGSALSEMDQSLGGRVALKSLAKSLKVETCRVRHESIMEMMSNL